MPEIILNTKNTELLDAWMAAHKCRRSTEAELAERKTQEHNAAREFVRAMCPSDAKPYEVFTIPVGDSYIQMTAGTIMEDNHTVTWRNEVIGRVRK